MDGFGCDCTDGEAIQSMREAGVEVELYHMTSFARTNHRTHRKLLVIDGKVGFTGGVGISDLWNGDADSPEHYRDSHYRVKGPVVAQMQAAFLDNWMKTRAVVLHGEDYFPKLEAAGSHRCQMFKSSPMEGSESARLMYLLSIAAAEHSIKVGNAYFVPDDLTMRTLIEAARRGVAVEVLLPGPNLDSMLVRAASRHRWGRLLKGQAFVGVSQNAVVLCGMNATCAGKRVRLRGLAFSGLGSAPWYGACDIEPSPLGPGPGDREGELQSNPESKL